MSDSPQVSRRDWFRLRVPSSQSQSGSPEKRSMLSHAGDRANQDGLKPVELPPNHDGMDLRELPPMREAVLSMDQVHSLFQDIEQLAQDIQLMQRGRNDQRASAANVSTVEQLRLAKSALVEGTVPRIQIRYRWQNALWIDTLNRQDDGIGLVRIAHQGL